MIAKRIMRGKAGDFAKLGEYIVNGSVKAKSHDTLPLGGSVAAREAAIWQRTADYIVDALAGGQRASQVRITNCQAENLEDAIAEIEAIQTINQRAKGDRTYHLVVSFPPGETPTPEQLHNIEDELCRAIGLGKHQRLSAVHTDTEHLHMHIAINQVHPETYALIEPFYDKRKLMRACEWLEIKHGLTRTNHGRIRVEASQPEMSGSAKPTPAPQCRAKPARALAMEHHGGFETLLSWAQREIKPSLLVAVDTGTGWQDLHRSLAERGLEIRRRGAGLIITNGKTAIKASDVDRLLSLKSLQDKWGQFVRADPQEVALVRAHNIYRRGPMQREVDELFDDWQRLSDGCRDAYDKLSVEIKEHAEWIKERKKNQRDIIHRISPLNALGREEEYRAVDRKINAMWREHNLWVEERRAEIRQAHPSPSWPEYLREAASNGNAAALRALRRNTSRYRQAVNAVIQPGAETDAAVMRELKPERRADGTVVYTLRDGGRVIDDGRQARVDRDSHIARALALTLLAARSKMAEVTIEGPEAQAYIETAARDKLRLHFRNSAQDQERKRLIPVFEREDATVAASGFIAQRNAARGTDASHLPYRLWQNADAGSAHFEGTEDLGEGIQAILLRKGNEILVLPRAASEVSASPAPGTEIVVSQNGQIAVQKGQTR